MKYFVRLMKYFIRLVADFPISWPIVVNLVSFPTIQDTPDRLKQLSTAIEVVLMVFGAVRVENATLISRGEPCVSTAVGAA